MTEIQVNGSTLNMNSLLRPGEYLRTRQKAGMNGRWMTIYFIRQLIGFIIYKGILEGFAFSRVETTTSDGDKDDDKLEQKRVYSDDQDKPLNIRYNTIAVEHQKSGVKGTLGLRALLYIVVAYLDKSHKKQAINKFIKHWLDKNADYKHRKKTPKSDDKSLDKKIKARCDYLISLYENKKENAA